MCVGNSCPVIHIFNDTRAMIRPYFPAMQVSPTPIAESRNGQALWNEKSTTGSLSTSSFPIVADNTINASSEPVNHVAPELAVTPPPSLNPWRHICRVL